MVKQSRTWAVREAGPEEKERYVVADDLDQVVKFFQHHKVNGIRLVGEVTIL